MIAGALTFITDRLNQYLNALDGTNSSGIVIRDLANTNIDGNQLILSLINITEENNLGKISLGRKSGFELADQTFVLELDVLISAHYSSNNYLKGIAAIDRILQAARSNVSFSQADSELPKGVEKITLERVNIDSDKIIQLWQASDTSHKPCLLYRVRMVCYANTDRVTSLPSL